MKEELKEFKKLMNANGTGVVFQPEFPLTVDGDIDKLLDDCDTIQFEYQHGPYNVRCHWSKANRKGSIGLIRNWRAFKPAGKKFKDRVKKIIALIREF